MKTAFAVILLLAAAAAIGLGIISAPASAQPARHVAVVVMRALPGQPVAAVVVAKTEVPRPKPTANDDLAPLAARPPEVKPAEPRPTEVKPQPAAQVAKPAEPRPAEPKAAEPKPAEPRPGVSPAPVAAKPPPAQKTPSAGVAPSAAVGGGSTDGSLNLRASDTADVYIDGRKVGGSPVLGHRVKAGKHKVRFDCYDAAGEARQGIVQTVEVPVEGEKDVEYECPAAE